MLAEQLAPAYGLLTNQEGYDGRLDSHHSFSGGFVQNHGLQA